MALSRYKEIGILAVLVAASTVVHGQINGPDFYRSPSGRVRSAQEAAAARAAYNHQQQQDARFEEFRRRARETRGSGSPMRRDSSKIVEALLKPTQAEVSSNDVLRGGATAGIFTFLGRPRCSFLSSDKRQADVDEMLCFDPPPGHGLQFSFRRKNYSPVGHADLGLTQGWFFGFGRGTQTILTDLGDLPIADVDLNSTDLRYLTGFVPARTLEEANLQRHELGDGISHSGRNFFNAVRATVNHTYLLRSIAYRGEMLRIIKTGKSTIKMDALKGDKRLDVIVAFRVLRIDEDGDVRILWRLLRSTESPHLEFPVKEIDGTEATTVVTVSN